jgi:hypothetical protein
MTNGNARCPVIEVFDKNSTGRIVRLIVTARPAATNGCQDLFGSGIDSKKKAPPIFGGALIDSSQVCP